MGIVLSLLPSVYAVPKPCSDEKIGRSVSSTRNSLEIDVISAFNGDALTKLTREKHETVASVLKALEMACEVPFAGHLLLGHSLLPRESTLSDAGVEDGSTVSFVKSTPPPLLIAGPANLEVWSGKSPQPLDGAVVDRSTGLITAACRSFDGRMAATVAADGMVELREVVSAQFRCAVRTSVESPTSISLDRQGLHVGVINKCGVVEVLHCDTGVRLSQWTRFGAKMVALSSDGSLAALDGSDGVATVWQTSTGNLVTDSLLHDGPVNAVCFVEDSQCASSQDPCPKLLSVSSDSAIRIWNFSTECCVYLVEEPCHRPLRHAVLSANQLSIIVCVGTTVQLWDRWSGECLLEVDHGENVACADLSRDGAFLVSTSASGATKMWSSASGRCVRDLTRHCVNLPFVAFLQP